MSQICKTKDVDQLKTGDIVSILKIDVLRPGWNDYYPPHRTVVITSGLVTNIENKPHRVIITIKSHDGRTLNYSFNHHSDNVSLYDGEVKIADLYLFDGILNLN